MPSKPIYTEVEGQRLKLTNLEKELYAGKAYSKAEIISYALEVAPFMLPHVKGRPLTLIRFPDGVGGKTFYTKNKPSWTPDWIPTTYLPWDEENEYLLANNAANLVWLANLAALEIHTMNSRIDQINRPDQFVVDLDPPEDFGFEEVRQVAFKMKTFLESYGYFPFGKLSGGKGIHLVVPVMPRWDYDTMMVTVKGLMKEFIKSNPDTTLLVHKNRRADKILLDIYRNHPGNTTVAPYSLRGKTGAPVSIPLTWDEIEKVESAQAFDLDQTLKYLRKNGDAWVGFAEKAAKLHDQTIVVGMTKGLEDYDAKRNFEKTSEPDSTGSSSGEDFDAKSINNKFTVHLHKATNLHYDLRLGEEDVLKSWAIPKGLPIEKGVKRLAIQTEDHPAKYLHFEGTIPKEEYGGGQMWVFDTGEVHWLKKTKTGYKFTLSGKALNATFSLYRIKGKEWIIERSESANLESFSVGIKPMLADAVKELPKKKDDFVYEIKWDGIRVIVYKKKDELKIMSRSGRDLTDQFPEFRDGKFLKVQNAIIDCELVCLDEAGRPVFSDIISRMHRIGKTNIQLATKSKPAYLYAFDCLYLDGRKLVSHPLTRRQEWLNAIFKQSDKTRISTVFEDGNQIYEAAKAMDLEGIMVKKKTGKYFPGNRSPSWQKIKFRQTFEAHIIGYTKGKGDRIEIFGALHLANPEGDGWKYLGKVGTGFDQKMMKEIWKKIEPLEQISKPFSESVDEESKTTWVLPSYLCELEYASFASTGHLREPVFVKIIV